MPVGSTHTVAAIGYIEHYGQQKLAVKLQDGIVYQAGENLEGQKEQLMDGCKIRINNTKLSATRKKFADCKVVQRGDWAGVLDYERVALLAPSKKCKAVKVLGVNSIEHKGQKRKLLLTEDGVVYNIKRSKLEDTVKTGQYV